ncbi:efflux RND transporter periplasmic adaptor subunit [soil metagenome]
MRAFYIYKHLSIFKITLLLLAVSFGIACGRSNAEIENQNVTENETVINVTVTKAESREVPAYIPATGSLVADETSDIAPKVAGKVVNIYADVGDFITRGNTIAKLDEQDARLRVAEAQANVKKAQAAVRQAEARLGLSPNGTFNSSTIPEVRTAAAGVEQAQAELRQAEANLRQAEANEKRYRELVETGDVAVITYETYRTARDTARAARDTAQARVNSAKQQIEAAVNFAKQNNQAIKSAEADVEAARTQVATAQAAVADTIVRAPFSGYISERATAVGEFVTSSSVIATILRSNPIKVQMQIAEADVPYISIGRGVSVQVDSYKDRSFGGSVTAINPAIDPVSRAATVVAQIENNDNALRTGMFATAKIVREGGSIGIFVPRVAVYRDEATQNYRVFVIEENVAKLKVVQIGTTENDFIQILSGVNADETVATSNLDKLYEGAKVSF